MWSYRTRRHPRCMWVSWAHVQQFPGNSRYIFNRPLCQSGPLREAPKAFPTLHCKPTWRLQANINIRSAKVVETPLTVKKCLQMSENGQKVHIILCRIQAPWCSQFVDVSTEHHAASCVYLTASYVRTQHTLLSPQANLYFYALQGQGGGGGGDCHILPGITRFHRGSPNRGRTSFILRMARVHIRYDGSFTCIIIAELWPLQSIDHCPSWVDGCTDG